MNARHLLVWLLLGLLVFPRVAWTSEEDVGREWTEEEAYQFYKKYREEEFRKLLKSRDRDVVLKIIRADQLVKLNPELQRFELKNVGKEILFGRSFPVVRLGFSDFGKLRWIIRQLIAGATGGFTAYLAATEPALRQVLVNYPWLAIPGIGLGLALAIGEFHKVLPREEAIRRLQHDFRFDGVVSDLLDLLRNRATIENVEKQVQTQNRLYALIGEFVKGQKEIDGIFLDVINRAVGAARQTTVSPGTGAKPDEDIGTKRFGRGEPKIHWAEDWKIDVRLKPEDESSGQTESSPEESETPPSAMQKLKKPWNRLKAFANEDPTKSLWENLTGWHTPYVGFTWQREKKNWLYPLYGGLGVLGAAALYVSGDMGTALKSHADLLNIAVPVVTGVATFQGVRKLLKYLVRPLSLLDFRGISRDFQASKVDKRIHQRDITYAVWQQREQERSKLLEVVAMQHQSNYNQKLAALLRAEVEVVTRSTPNKSVVDLFTEDRDSAGTPSASSGSNRPGNSPSSGSGTRQKKRNNVFLAFDPNDSSRLFMEKNQSDQETTASGPSGDGVQASLGVQDKAAAAVRKHMAPIRKAVRIAATKTKQSVMNTQQTLSNKVQAFHISREQKQPGSELVSSPNQDPTLKQKVTDKLKAVTGTFGNARKVDTIESGAATNGKVLAKPLIRSHR